MGAMGKHILLGAVVGLVAALAATAILKLLGTDLDAAVIGGVAGGVSGAIVPGLARRSSSLKPDCDADTEPPA